MNGHALPASSNDTFVEAFRNFSAKFIAAKAKASPRTVEGWKQGKAIPHGRHVLAMLSDDDLCDRLLKAAGQGDVAHLKETVSALRKALNLVEE